MPSMNKSDRRGSFEANLIFFMFLRMVFYFAEISSFSSKQPPSVALPNFPKRSPMKSMQLCSVQLNREKKALVKMKDIQISFYLSSLFLSFTHPPFSSFCTWRLFLSFSISNDVSQQKVIILHPTEKLYITISLPKDKLKSIYGIMNTIWMSKTKSTYSSTLCRNSTLGICGNYLYVFFGG